MFKKNSLMILLLIYEFKKNEKYQLNTLGII